MTEPELGAFLLEQRTVICATNGAGGWPHLMPLWYVVREGELWAWTYAKSQKVRNLERDPRATLQVEAGDSYDQLRGVMLESDTEIHRRMPVVAKVVIFSARSLPMPGISVSVRAGSLTMSVTDSVRSRMVWAALRYARSRNGFSP